MRPGQLTPENPARLVVSAFAEVVQMASMRPGQLTPENIVSKREARIGSARTEASMRPGQLTPENRTFGAPDGPTSVEFLLQ